MSRYIHIWPNVRHLFSDGWSTSVYSYACNGRSRPMLFYACTLHICYVHAKVCLLPQVGAATTSRMVQAGTLTHKGVCGNVARLLCPCWRCCEAIDRGIVQCIGKALRAFTTGASKFVVDTTLIHVCAFFSCRSVEIMLETYNSFVSIIFDFSCELLLL